MKLHNLLHKSLSIILALILVLSPLSTALAQEAETNSLEPVVPLQTIEQPQEPSQPSEPDPNSASEPTSPSEPEAPQPPTVAPLQTVTEEQYFGQVVAPTTTSQEVQNASSPQGQSSNGGVGDTSLVTGDAVSNSGIANTGNTNQSTTGGCCEGGSANVVNSGNGALSNNASSATTTNNNDTNQANSAVIGNELQSAAVTGKNDTSFNVGDSSITTGDANTTGTIYNDINSNLAGVSVSEFNIADDYNGDYVLDFAANCVIGCGGTGMNTVANTDNGAYSDNSVSSNTTNNNSTNQVNDAVLTNNLDLLANSGDNTASYNTNGDSNITTGDANVAANVLNFVNNNMAGNVVLGVVNIFGNLIGDILLPEGFGSSTCTTCGGNTTVANTDNGAHSTNTAQSNTTTSSDTFQNNDATIENNLILGATTGDNTSSFNTDGNSQISTGDTSVNGQVLNVANMNIAGGDWFLVIVNRAGQWVGQILGAPEGATFGGTSGTEFIVGENGEITAANSGNGAGSTNNASTITTNNTSVNQDNNAHIVNNINLDANTGGNSTSFNTGGNSNITTGDATVIANIVNFVNNNITGGRLVVTVVNVFGSWMGDFVTPGHEQRAKNTQTNQVAANTENNNSDGRGGPENTGNSSNNQPEDTQSDEEGTNNTTANTQNTTRGTNNSGNGASVSSGDGSFIASLTNKGNNNEVAVLGEATTVNDTVSKAIKINLAWLVIIVPGFIALLITGRIIRSRFLSTKKV